MKREPGTRSLFSYVSIHLALLALLTILAVSIPAIIYLQLMVERQAWSEIVQGAATNSALLEVKQLQLLNHAKLVAERPTLLDLLEQEDREALAGYLSRLVEGIQSDLITICDPEGQILVSTRQIENIQLCLPANNLPLIQQSDAEAWMFQTHPIVLNDEPAGTAIVGEKLDHQFADSIEREIGLEYLLLDYGKLIASSLPTPAAELEVDEINISVEGMDPGSKPLRFEIEHVPYLAISNSLTPGGLETILALPMDKTYQEADERIFFMLLGIASLLIVTLVLSNIIAHRISKPLEELSAQAIRTNSEFIHTPITTTSRIKELVEMADAYEIARIDLSKKVSELQQEQDWIRHLLASIAEGIMTLDPDNRVLFFSPAAERITGWNKDEILNQNIDDFFKFVDKEDRFSDNLPSPGEKYFLNLELAQGRQATLSISGAEFLPGDASDSQMALVFRDVTEEVAINRLLGQFLSNVAHEFRTPLSALAASVELLEDQFPDFNSSEVMELIRSQKLGVLGLETLIDNLLESSSIEARRFRVMPRTFDLEEIVTDVEQTLAPLLEKHGQTLGVKIPLDLPLVHGDPRRTIQVLINLLSNAIKYGPENSEITLQAVEWERRVRVSISDRGPGISPEYRQEIFTRFNLPRAENERAKPGAGLGLSVVKAIVEAQGGEVGVEDNPGSGACFWFTLRMAKSK